MLFQVRYRTVSLVQTRLIEARNLEWAERVARAWVAEQPGYRYIGTELAVVADETILQREHTPKEARIGA